MPSLLADLKSSLRTLRAQPGFVLVAVLSLTIGIGANTAVFSALNSLLFSPLALRDLDESVIVFHSSRGRADRGTSYPAFQHYAAQRAIFDDVMAFSGARPLSLIDGDRHEEVYAELVSAGAFRMADLRLRMGRGWTDDVDRATRPDGVAVVSERFWRRRLAEAPDAVGRTINLNGQLFTITGVVDASFKGLDSEVAADLWIPLASWAHLTNEPGRLSGEEHWLTTVARLARGVSREQAEAAVAVAGSPFQREAGDRARLRPARERHLETPAEALMLAGSAFALTLIVLALACTNIANLLLARAAAREREMAIRAALGASRGRLLRIWLIDSLVLSLAAGALGLILAVWLLDLVAAFKSPVQVGHASAGTLPISFSPDPVVMLFAVGLSIATAVALGLAAGYQGTRPNARRFAPGFNLRSSIIALQMALASGLLIPCGLLVRSAVAGAAASPGFDAHHVLLLAIGAEQGGVKVRKPAGFERDLAARIAALPGVESATVMDPVPLWFASNNTYFGAEGGATESTSFARIGSSYFETLRIPLVAGRDFSAADTSSSPPVAIVNETLARRLWPGANAVGRYLREGSARIQVVGVAKDATYRSLADTAVPFVYVPIAQAPSNNVGLSLALRSAVPQSTLAPAIEREVRALVPEWPAFQFRRLDEGLALQQALPRAAATILGVLGACGLLLAAIGIYGVLAYVVRQRTPEIAIRLALGAQLRDVVGLIVQQGMVVCLAGGAIGTVFALVASWFLASVLYGVGAADPLTFTAVPLLLIGVALMACYLPARQAAAVNVIAAIKND